MIQFNLLPDVKINLIKARKMNRTVISLAFLVTVASVFIVLLMFSLQLAQKKHINDLDKDIRKYSAELAATPNLTKILTVQNQLNALPSLYAARPAVTRLPGYLDQTTPGGVRLSSLDITFEDSKLKVSGSADSLELVNKYADTLKFTTFAEKNSSDSKVNAFKDVVLTAFSKTDKQTTFTIELVFDPAIFDVTKDIALSTPTTVTTRSQITAPADLFNATGNQ